MGAQKVHGGVKGRRRIVLPQGLHGLPKVIGIPAGDIGQQRRAEGVVHQPVGLTAQQIPPPLGVGDLIGAVLPHLADQDAVRGRLLHGGADLLQKPVRQLIRHIQPPAGSSGTQPPADNGVLGVNDEIHIRGRGLLHRWQSADAPPGVVGIRPVVEPVPAVPGRVLALGCAQGGVIAVGIEVHALGSGVVEHAVQNHPHPPLSGLGAESAEIGLRAQHGVDAGIVRCVITVVGGGLENGAEVQRGDTKGLQIVQFRRDPRQSATKEVPVADLPIRIRPPLRRVIPVLVDPAPANQTRRVHGYQTAETIWKNLVCHTCPKPAGRTAFLVDRQLPGHGLSVTAVAGLVQQTAGAVLPPEAEVIPEKIGQLRRGQCAGKAKPLACEALQG